MGSHGEVPVERLGVQNLVQGYFGIDTKGNRTADRDTSVTGWMHQPVMLPLETEHSVEDGNGHVLDREN